MRRLHRYACGSHFIRPHIFALFWARLASRGASFVDSRALPGASGAFFYAQAAEICVRRPFHMIRYTSGAYVLCAGCGDPCLASFWLLPGAPLRPPGIWEDIFHAQAAAICVRKHLPVTPARKPLQSNYLDDQGGASWRLSGGHLM